LMLPHWGFDVASLGIWCCLTGDLMLPHWGCDVALLRIWFCLTWDWICLTGDLMLPCWGFDIALPADPTSGSTICLGTAAHRSAGADVWTINLTQHPAKKCRWGTTKVYQYIFRKKNQKGFINFCLIRNKLNFFFKKKLIIPNHPPTCLRKIGI
jgi:hypothetical protein